MKRTILVHKLDENGDQVWSYHASIIEQTADYIRLEAAFDRDSVAVGPLLLQRDDLFVETFYFDRWYNVFEVFDPERKRFKGWYCNIARPAWIDDDNLYAEDLALDLVVLPDGSHAILDQDEFDHLEIPQPDRLQAQLTLHDLQRQVETRSGIFADHTRP